MVAPESDVKKEIKKVLDQYGAFHFMYVPTGYGKKGIHDHIACVPLKIEQHHVGKTLGVFVSIEAKTMKGQLSAVQEVVFDDVKDAAGFVMVVRGTSEEPGNMKKFKEFMRRVFGRTKQT